MNERARVSWRVPVTVAALAGACTTPTLPAENDAEFPVVLPADIDVGPAELRYAITWLEGTRARVTNGGRVRGTSFQARFAWPSGIRAHELQPIESLLVASGESPASVNGQYFAPFSVYADSYRPRIVVYRDLDGDEELTLERASADRILASDSYAGVAAVLDIDGALRQLTLSQAREFYADGHEYGRFVMVTGSGLSLQILDTPSILLDTGSHAEVRENIRCARSVVTTRAAAETRVSVDESLDPTVACPRGASECRGESLETVEPPAHESDAEVQRYAQCRRSAELGAFTVYTSAPKCGDCTCTDEPIVELYLASRDALPSWWPCGDEVSYCDDGVEVTSTAFCTAFDWFQEPGANDAGSDAGTDAGP